jgi:hypothetical protein
VSYGSHRWERARAYQVSPTFARFQPFLEATDSFWGAGNKAHSISNGRSPAACADIPENLVRNSGIRRIIQPFCTLTQDG